LVELIPTIGAFKCLPPSEPKKGAPPKENTPPSEATVQYEGTFNAALADGEADGAAAGAEVVGVGVVVVGAEVLGVVEVGVVEVGAEVLGEEAGAVVLVDAPVVGLVVVSAPAPATGTIASPNTMAAAAGSAPRRRRVVLCAGRVRARGLMSSEVRDGPTSPLGGSNPVIGSTTVLSSDAPRSMTGTEFDALAGQSRRNSATRKARSRDCRAFNRGSHAVV
jgi:hypothetical protein